MRECGSCTACCTWLIGEAYDSKFGNGVSCKYLTCSGCGIYEKRPTVCKKYQCAWSQYLFPEEMRPDKCGFLASVEQNENGQYLKVVKINNDSIDKSILNYLNTWSEKMNVPIIFCNL